MNSGVTPRSQFIAKAVLVFATIAVLVFAGCSPTGSATGSASGSNTNTKASTEGTPDKITIAFLPDSSASDLTAARDAFAKAIKDATGIDAEVLTTTDYNVTIESVASGKAQMALLGAEGYVQANKKNPEVEAIFTNSDDDGKLDGACYYSRIAVLKENADQYKNGNDYSIDNIKGKSFSFVSPTSTSGFKVPTSVIMSKFGIDSADKLQQPGEFFSEVLFGQSHAGSAVNLLNGDCDAAAFNDVDIDMNLEKVSGEANAVGSVYKVKANAEAPFDAVRGKEFTIIGVKPVLNAPFVVNTKALNSDLVKKIQDHFTSSKVASDPAIFVDPKDEKAKGMFKKKTDKTCFVKVTDSWYDPIRKMAA